MSLNKRNTTKMDIQSLSLFGHMNERLMVRKEMKAEVVSSNIRGRPRLWWTNFDIYRFRS